METKEDAIYTLQTTELLYAKHSLLVSIENHIILFILVGTILSSFLVSNHVFKHFPFLYIIFASASISMLFRMRRKRRVYSVEISFYSNCIKIHRECVIVRLGKATEEFHVFSYEPLPNVTYDARKHIISFEGDVHSELYRYVPRSIEKRLDKVLDHTGQCSFRLYDKELDIVSVIQQYSPIEVRVLESGKNI